MRLTDDQVADIRAMAAEGGISLDAIARRYGTTKQHVSRLVRGEQRQTLTGDASQVLAGVSVAEVVLARLEDAGVVVGESVAAVAAVALAGKLDDACRSSTAQAALAAPGLARTLMECLSEAGVLLETGGPRLGSLRGAEAVIVARELGYPEPEGIDVERLDEIEVLRLRRLRRRGGNGVKG